MRRTALRLWAGAVRRCSTQVPSTLPSTDGTTIVKTHGDVDRVLHVLQSVRHRPHAWDTEAVDIDVKSQSPVGHGRVLCATAYCGPDVDFGNGPRLFIDNHGESDGILRRFTEYFADESVHKVFHNYGFDRHILFNHGVDVRGLGGDTMHMARLLDTSRTEKGGRGGYSLEALSRDYLGDEFRKVPMKERFSLPRILKSGAEGKGRVMPSLLELHTCTERRREWIAYATYDAEVTWHLARELQRRLRKERWHGARNMWDFYLAYWAPFGELLTDMEREGMRVDADLLHRIEIVARRDRIEAEKRFLEWATKISPDARMMNVGSEQQKRQLLFAPFRNKKNGEVLEREKEFMVPNTDGYIDPASKTGKPKRDRPIRLRGLGLQPCGGLTAAGWPSTALSALRSLQSAAELKERDDGDAIRSAVQELCDISAIDTLLSSFIVPLQQIGDAKSRVHASLNINTETGRLSCRRPNLQNQPALEKDRYRIRSAFRAAPGNTLIVADYGQLELRLLAHMAKCTSMLDAFRAGGDFHSRTAISMYEHVRKAVDEGKVLLEWDASKGKASAPLIKDVYGSERRKAKTLNFSIAYGKTAHGLSKDWNTSVEEATETLERWYADRPEVREWQRNTIARAYETGRTWTLMGRYRPLPLLQSKSSRLRSHAERAAINTPIQGGAADVVTKAMLKIHADRRLRDLGFRLVLQVHDEIILEGPQRNRDEALDIVIQRMQFPFDKPLLVDLTVDAKAAESWYDAK